MAVQRPAPAIEVDSVLSKKQSTVGRVTVTISVHVAHARLVFRASFIFPTSLSMPFPAPPDLTPSDPSR